MGGGARTCIGDHFATLEATLALATIIRKTRIHSLGDDFPLATPFTMIAAEPILARVRADVTDAPKARTLTALPIDAQGTPIIAAQKHFLGPLNGDW